MNVPQLIVIVGPTAIGKTDLAIHLAQHYNTEIISADARQFFKETEIGTAKPSANELKIVRHHFINSHSIHDFFSTGDFELAALQLIDKLFQTHATLIMVGGSGLYIDAVCKGLDELPETSLKIRKKLMEELAAFGIKPLLEQLKLCDPKTFEKIDLHNTQRVIRALEFYQSTGKPISSFQTGKPKQRNFEIIKIGLQIDRALLYERINQRVDKMLQNGLLEEAKSLFPFRKLNSLNTVGYKELFEYFEGITDYETAVEKIKQNTRRFAKRQITWFKKDETTTWFTPDEKDKIITLLSSKYHLNC